MQNAASQITPEYLPEADAARLIGVSAATLKNSRTRGTLLGHEAPLWVRMGSAVRYRRRDLLEWAERVAVECRAAQG